MLEQTPNLLRVLNYRHRAVVLRSRAEVTADPTSRATYLMLANYWEEKARRLELGGEVVERDEPDPTA